MLFIKTFLSLVAGQGFRLRSKWQTLGLTLDGLSNGEQRAMTQQADKPSIERLN
jgi:hypothetical protein